MPAPLAISHLNFPARDPEALRRFYAEKLGLRIYSSMLYGGRTCLNIAKGEPLPPGSFHFGFWLESKEAVREWAARLEADGVTLHEPYVDHGAYATVYVEDPEGNVIELFWEEPPVFD
ncbi:MAG: VOC family protein [Sandaracinaceae bacterium]